VNKKSGEIVLGIIVTVALISAGFALITGQHNALVLEARQNGLAAGADLNKLHLKGGVVEAVSQNKGMATLTVLGAAAAGYATYKANGGSSDKDSTPNVSITGNGNTYGGRDVTEIRQKTTTTTTAPESAPPAAGQ